MKKFNKSKVIIPALAMIALTTAASATGTVAWFTANRATEVSANSFVAFDDNRGLKITAKKGTGTDVNNNIVTPTGRLTDASYDFEHVWSDVAKNDGTGPDSYDDVTEGLKSAAKDVNNDGEIDVYYAVQWTYEIELTNKTGKLIKYVDVLFDETSTFGDIDENSTDPGFRIAMKCGNQKLVFGNSSVKTHVNSASSTAEFGNEDGVKYLTTNTGKTKADDGVDHSAENGYLGTFQTADGKLIVNCTAWYEGNDPSVVSGKNMSSVSATLRFYARNSANPVAAGD